MRRDVFQAIVDPVRRDILDLLAKEALTVNEVASAFEISRPAISRHIRILEECGVIEVDQQGRQRYCRIRPKELVPAFLWIERYRKLWDERLDNFEHYLKELQTKNKEE